MPDQRHAAQRSVLPIPGRVPRAPTAHGVAAPSGEPDRPPDGAPNVLVVLLDHVGFGAGGPFGGPVWMPTAERLAGQGLTYNRFHTTALCSPTRAALLSGRNHHSVGLGGGTEAAMSAAGRHQDQPNPRAPLAEILRLNGYRTAHVGECRVMAPDRAERPEHGHRTPDLTDKAIRWVRRATALTPGRPFFLYFAPGATHGPHHVPPGWAERYRGRFDEGWDHLRERTFARQKERGIVPAGCDLTARPDGIPGWDELAEAHKPALRRRMEAHAGALSHADHHVGRLVDALARLDVLDDTLVYYIIGGLGAAEADHHPAVGWAHALCTPYRWTRQIASHWGDTRNGTIVHWPNGFTARGELRHQFCHAIDVAPTVLEVAGLPEPATVHGVPQEPMHGTSMAYSFTDADAPERHTTQYFELFRNRGIYHNGWSAVARHGTRWRVRDDDAPVEDDVWELYDGTRDWTQAHDLADENPETLRRLKRLFALQATKYRLFPVDDRLLERINSDLAGRPAVVDGTSQLLFEGMAGLGENRVLNLRNTSHSVTAEVEVPAEGADGVIAAQGGVSGGWALQVRRDRLAYRYSLLDVGHTSVIATSTVGPGRRQVRMEFTYDGGGLGRGGTVRLFVDGVQVGSGRVARTHAHGFPATGSPVRADHGPAGSAFTGEIHWVRLDIGEDDHSHVFDECHVGHLAMARR